MKKLYIILALIVLVSACSVAILADQYHPGGNGQHDQRDQHDQHGPGSNDGHRDDHNFQQINQEREDARYILHRTSFVLSKAQDVAKHQHFVVGLGLATAHQQRAQELYQQGAYRDAIFHSLRARNLAFRIVEGNHQRYDRIYVFDDREGRYARMSPRDEDLDRSLDHSKVHRDNDVLRLIFNFDIK